MDHVQKDKLIRRMHDAPQLAVLAVTGGGSQAISDLLAVPGASRTVLEAIVPYASTAMAELLGGPPGSYCTEHTARIMATVAWERARRFAPEKPRDLIGLGCTASLASDRPKRGEHRIHVAWHTTMASEVCSLVLEKGFRTRAEEENVAAMLVLESLAAAMGLERGEPLLERALTPALSRGERGIIEEVQIVHKEAPAEWTAVLLGEARRAAGTVNATEPPTGAIFSGAFNPLHEGHRGILQIGEKLLNLPVALEISLVNVDKPPLDFIEIERRIAGLDGLPVWLTRAATFVEKAQTFPGAVFLVGADTIARIADPKYYSDDQCQADSAIESIAKTGCRFLVFGRLVEGRFATLDALNLPPALLALCEEVPQKMFRQDVSSTGIRQVGAEDES